MIGSSFTDPMLGIDVHFEMVPTPAPVPTPIPNPFTGVVFDPVGLAVGIAIGGAISAVMGAPFQGPVLYWTAFPATNTGTEGKHVPGHIMIPPGTAWAPFPKTPKPVIHPGETPKPALPVKPEDDAVVVFGSKTVTVMGSNAVRLGDIALSCSEPLRLPSTVVLAVPKGAPILIGGPPSLDIMAAIMASLRTRFVSDSMHAALSRLKPSRFRNFMHRAVCFLTGHPVDVASGKVITEAVDAELSGPLPLKIERVYSSAFASRRGPIGHGWCLSVDQMVWRERGKVVLLAEDGREIEFDTFDFPDHRIEAGQRVDNPVERLSLHCRGAQGWTVTSWADGTRREFAPVAGGPATRAMLQRIRDRSGQHEIDFQYDARGCLAQIRDSAGRLVQLERDPAGRVAALLLPHPGGEGMILHRSYAYDQRGDLVKVVDPLGHAWVYGYVGHLLTQETDRNGHSFFFSYDGMGQDAWCVRTWGGDGIYDHVLSYDKRKRITFVTDSTGQTTQYHMNLAGLVVKVVDPLGEETQYEYDPDTLRRTKTTDTLGQETVFTYDARGNGTSVTFPDGSEVRLDYDEHGNLVRQTEAHGADTTWRYDAQGRVIARTTPDGASTIYGYERGLLATIVQSDGSRTQVEHDARGNLVSVTNAAGAVARWTYDALGRELSRTDPRGVVTRIQRDLAGRELALQRGDGAVRSMERDREGNLLRVKDTHRDVRYAYDALGHVAMRAEGEGSLSFGRDTEGRLIEIVNEAGHKHVLERDEAGRIRAEIAFDGARREYERDPLGRMVTIRRPSGSSTSFEYDPLDRLVEVTHGDGETESFEYRADSMLMSARNGSAVVEFERDVVGRILRESCDGHWVASTYDRMGSRVRMQSSFGAVLDVDRDTMGEASGLTASTKAHPSDEPWQARYERDLVGEELSRALPGGVKVQWQRDDLGRPVRHTVHGEQGRHHDVVLRWRPDGRLRQVESAAGITQYGHDAVGNLAWSQEPDESVELRMPDAAGNLFRRRDRGDREYGSCGELRAAATSAGPRRYEYDEDGQLVERREPDGGIWRYTWSVAGRLVAVERPDGTRVRYEYDALGRRIRKHFEGATTHFVWDGNVPLHEWTETEPAQTEEPEPVTTGPERAPLPPESGTDAHPPRGPPPGEPPPPPLLPFDDKPTVAPKAPADLITWVFDPERFAPAAKLVGEERLSIVTDQTGVPIAMFDSGGRKVWEARIDIYGELHVPEGMDRHACPFRWPGQYEDAETGLRYNRHRYYDPDAGQYISRDPIGMAGDLAPYRYVADPLTLVDPFGLMPWRWNPDTGMGHHLVPRGKANSAGFPLLGTKRDTPTFFPNPYNPGDHELIHRAQRPDIGPLQGPWTGTSDELLAAARNGLDDLGDMRGDLKIPRTGEILARDVTPTEAFDRLMKWHDDQKPPASCS